MNDVLVAVIAIAPALLGSWAAYTAARRSARRDMRADRAGALRDAVARAEAADHERETTRLKLLQLERQFDRLRMALRRVVDAFDAIDSTNETLADARVTLDELEPNI